MKPSGGAKLGDFGVAGELSGRAHASTMVGTVSYMSPEQDDGMATAKSDIYSLGVVFYEMLTGELPIGRFEPPSKKVRVDVRLDDVVLRTLEAVPDRRYQHASDVKTEVETIINDGTGRPVVPSAPPVIMSSVRDRLKVPAVGLAVASAVDILVTLAIVLASLRIPGAPAEGLVVSVRTLMFSTIGVSSFVHGALLALGATSMFSLRSYRIAVAAAVVAILPFGPASPISLPFGIWALILLSKGDVQAAFNTPSR